ncbi:YheC/YheD family protein [Evansella halocellulosilytica]|uniref:YheC/YheD family protein n=1 Tax=Evansella halocellulosilytica TaxID=2011013 RepID=UPI000BB687C0|nr:YheC/YheD family protein [Evansella halocellulosilytica]
MVKIDHKQVNQLLHINDTIIEGLEQLLVLQKKKKQKESILLYGSLVDGVTVIENWINTQSELSSKIIEANRKIKENVLLLARELERGNSSKILEILQFSLIPQFKKHKQLLEEEFNLNNESSNSFSIGVYLCKVCPLDVMPEPRIKALVSEAEKQNVELFFFSSEDVNFDKETIHAKFYSSENNKVKEVNFPNVVHNINPSAFIKQSSTEKKLKRLLPFTTFGIGDKLNVPKKFVKENVFVEYLVPFKIITHVNLAIDFLNKNHKAVIKPVNGRQGQKIYFIEKKGTSYHIKDHKKSKIFSSEQLFEFIKVLLDKNEKYMIQKYIQSVTKGKAPFDIRAHVQKNGKGEWELTKIYPRIGSKKSILSNISRGGKTDSFSRFLSKEYGQYASAIEKQLIELTMDITWTTDKLYGSAIDELGLDLAIDTNHKIWIHEVNGGPQTTYHEEERAVNTIAYAKYIGENGLYLTNKFDKTTQEYGFNSQLSELPEIKQNNRINIGLLIGDENEDEALKKACAYVAHYEDVNFYYFTPNDIDYEEKLIKGHYYINHKWENKITKYPDVIYDRLRLRGIKSFHKIYQEFEGIPFTNEFFGNSMSKLEVYNRMSSVEELNSYIIPYRKIDRIKDVHQFLDNYEAIIIKPEIGSFAKGVHLVEKIKLDKYYVVEGGNKQYLNYNELTNYFRSLIRKGTLIVQKYIRTRTKEGNPFDIRAHMLKNDQGEWDYAIIYPRIGFNYATISPLDEGGQISNFKGFIKRTYSINEYDYFVNAIKEMTQKFAVHFEEMNDHPLNELAFDIAIDEEKNLYLIEINVNKPGVLYHEFEVAQLVIPYCKYLFNSHY